MINMIIVVIGGSGSGKSEFAENLAVQLDQDNLVYIATMQPNGEEARKRIERHQKLRQDKNFKSVECYSDLDTMSIPQGATVLLECMSNLVANEMFSEADVLETVASKVERGIRNLIYHSGNLIIVTNNVFDDGLRYDSVTLEYMKTLAQINQWLCTIADQVKEVVHGIGLDIKEKE